MTTTSMKVDQVAAPLRQRVAENLRVAINTGRFKPGERLIERELCDLLGVSRTAVREALRQLETEGLVHNVPNRGPQVATISVEEARGIYEVRGALEALIGKRFTENATDKDIAQLVAINKRLSSSYSSGDVQKILKVKGEFYGKLIEGAKNESAEFMLKMIHSRANFLRSISLSQADRWPKSREELERIVQLIQERKPREVAEAFEAHIQNAAIAALAVL